ncbi:DUF3597 domain-containing protein [Beijerinckia sp. L45]|uniref:DUF3597 domain-containing protein n=1 Tax=Beijerinckia sp. L45 TaxID=1641855 RepID=UPI00131DF840|nr:DUF3597 domain-containing protein [Beijerinckia sp. L45]
MSIFGTILSKVFGDHHQAAAPSASAGAPAPSADPSAPADATPPAPDSATPAAPTSSAAPVDVAAVLDGMEDKSGQDLDWRKSIVDLMKLLGLDSSLSARKELAGELHYTGDTNDSATMNIWLHKEVMQKFTENGGKVPADLH